MGIELRHAEILAKGEMVHFARGLLSTARPDPQHSHDFYELFWVQNGCVRHHLPDGPILMFEGEMAVIPPGQLHGVQAKGDHCLVVSLSIHSRIIDGLMKRHAKQLADFQQLQTAKLDSRALADLNGAALKLERSNRGALATEAFLLPVLLSFGSPQIQVGLPEWLAKAMKDAQDPDVFRNGSSGLVALTGKAHAHVSRTMRAHLGQSPSEFINHVRMTYAARQLVTDTESVQEIAEQCGIPNMAHFHKLFRNKHGITPLKYRQKFQRDVIQP